MTSKVHATAGLVASNAAWNLARYVINWMVLLVVPPFLIHHMANDAYATWMLLLQIATYYSMVDTNMQTTVARFTARSVAREDRDDLSITLSSILAFLIILAFSILLLGLVAAAMLGVVFPSIPHALLPTAQLSAVIIVGALAVSLPCVTIVGAFLGYQRNHVVTVAIVLSKLANGVAMILAVIFGGALISLAVCFALTTLMAPLIYLRFWSRFHGAVKLRLVAVRATVVREFAGYSGAVGLVTMSSILMSGLALPIVGIYDFAAVPAFSLAFAYANMLLIPQAAILAAALPMLSGRSVDNNPVAMGDLLLRFARFSSISLALFTAGLMIITPFFLRLWIGPVLAEQVRLPALLLMLAQFVGLSTHPYRIAVLGVGQVMKTIPAILIEGVTSIILSLVLVRWWGGTGVAMAILFASLIGVAGQCLISMPRTTAIMSRPLAYTAAALGRPFLAILPMIAVTTLFWNDPLSITATAGIGIVVLGAALSFVVYFNLTASERQAGHSMALAGIRQFRRRITPTERSE
ncbi:O-antigen/teichoic acid export membrane protein [Sphingomonas sp. SORGH_AS802]|nr:O-antigen/teichoic acid export membrane protein [Sphingomonas sp. SORGH_AS_0438]MDR6135586.1 O-antigen/teichoic acid export membrane protein [Sphingomonas sp. SORGH_AS_0802]